MTESIPTYLQYDESTFTDITFTSSLADTFHDLEVLEPLPSEAIVNPPPSPPNSRHSVRRGSKTLFKRAIKAPMINITKRSIHLSNIWSQKAIQVSKIAIIQAKGFIVRKTIQTKNYLQRKKLEHELKSYGSFRTKKGFVEVGSEEKCMDQYELDSCYESCGVMINSNN
mmetsp:Transcript_1055/g.1888  ORF Transcript_1055/g.1888 Transcript_1055/m.1888 type:complete len:169 (+) Transcript_1055:361-867(+)